MGLRSGSGDTPSSDEDTSCCDHFNLLVRLVPKLSPHFISATSLPPACLRGCNQTTYPVERMHSLVQKFRNLLEASWALSPTMVGLAGVTLDLAALLHLRIKATNSQVVQIPGDRRPCE